MSRGWEPSIQQNAVGQVKVRLPDERSAICASRADAELVLGAVQRFFEGQTGRKLSRETLAALERAGMNAANSVLYRSALHNVEEE